MLHLKEIPSAVINLILRATTSLLSFILGIPYCSKPPGRSLRSNTVTVYPACKGEILTLTLKLFVSMNNNNRTEYANARLYVILTC